MVYIVVLHVTGVSVVSPGFFLFAMLFTDPLTELLWKGFGVGGKVGAYVYFYTVNECLCYF